MKTSVWLSALALLAAELWCWWQAYAAHRDGHLPDAMYYLAWSVVLSLSSLTTVVQHRRWMRPDTEGE